MAVRILIRTATGRCEEKYKYESRDIFLLLHYYFL